MKTALTVLSMIVVPALSHASSFDINCSSSDGSVQTKSGHRENSITITGYDYKTGHETKYQFDSYDFRTESANEHTISEERHGGNCRSGDNVTGIMYKKVYSQDVRITRADGSLFDKSIMGVTQDRKAVEAQVICEQVVTNIIPCNLSK